ncbi:ATP-binding protein [Tistrella bauzanensis]|uniref:ATP-binding protein Uup n=1 Tax=Tistrella bauzanensis TaxID=657419 RepID=A0ABQ1I8N2_9PROT|nr:ATP-binding cassette domain-containing protein [Tistrella bauzanensis]GGB23473.1 ATP-binding protein [Tistrella bauzanensis]
MSAPLISLAGIRVTFGGGDLIEEATLAVSAGDRIALVGRNGAGKSTLLRIMGGLAEADGGEIARRPGLRAAYMAQDPQTDTGTTVRAYIEEGLVEAGQGDRHYRVDQVAVPLSLDPERMMSELSGGNRRRAALARALAVEPELLLLDEPTNHMDLPTIEWLEAELARFRGGLVVISHDRAFLDRVAGSIAWLYRRRLVRHDIGYSAFEAQLEDLRAQEDQRLAKMADKLARETLWLNEGLTARRKRNERRARGVHELRAQLAAERQDIERTRARAGIAVASAETSGRLVIEAEGLVKHFQSPSGEITVADGFSTRIMRGARVGIIGRNGAGKTTLVKMLIGEIEPDAGEVKLGTNLEIAYFDQHRAALDLDATLWDTLADGGGDQVTVRGQPRHVVAYLRDFLFDEGQARQKVRALSGGERNRLLLAKLFLKPCNLLVMDEPTNDLDLDTLDLLEDVLDEYDGTVLLISHDRAFLDRLATSVIAVDGDGQITEYAGGWSDADAQRKRAAEAAREAAREAGREAAAAKRGGGAASGGAASGAAGGRPQAAAQKLSFKEARELDELPKRMAVLEKELAALAAKMGDPALYTRDPAAAQAAADRASAARAELDAAEERWLELEEKREAIAAAKGR